MSALRPSDGILTWDTQSYSKYCDKFEIMKEIPSYDVIIVGAGLSGIGAAFHVQDKCPDRSYIVLEGRAAMGGTWDLFKYPGIRSDSDMFTLGFSFNPWKNPKAIADGPAILKYIKETARDFGIDKNIRFNHKVANAIWIEETAEWELDLAEHEAVSYQKMRCKFLFTCCGYYNYAQGHKPHFPNSEAFEGTIVHPQEWDTSLNYTDKKVVVIGSGATAVTLVPEMAKKASKVTMLQRSPTYIMNLPSEDPIANFFRKIFPKQWAHTLSRWKNILVSMLLYQVSRRWPNAIRNLLQGGVKKELGEDYMQQHFVPKYNPWDQRLCLIPDNDLFNAVKEKKAEVVTDTIEQFTPTGIKLDSGKELDADIVVTATGLQLQLLGGMQLQVNGKTIETQNVHCYRGVMLSGIPNFAVAIGYTNASWTLKCDLNCHFVTRILNYMQEHEHEKVTPRFDSSVFETEPLLDFDAGYVKRANHILPKQGSKAPWKVYQNYIKDTLSLKYGKVSDRFLEYQ